MKNSVLKISLVLFSLFLIANDVRAREKKKKIVEIKQSIYIDVPREELWKITALDFGHIDKWISGVNKSVPEGDGVNGSVCTQRSCDPSYKGFDQVVERIIEYEAENYRLKYIGAEGFPKMVKSATNEWTHTASGNGTEMTMHVTMELKGLMGAIMKGPMKKQMSKILGEALEELKLYAETGELHPRKIEAMAKYEKELAKKNK